MVRVVHREQGEINMEYVNVPEGSSRRRSVKDTEMHPGQKLMRVVAVSFGLLCFLQVALNVSLRLVLYTPDKQTLGRETFCKNVSAVEDKWRTLADPYLKKGWVYFHPSFYYISLTTKSWHESRKFCLQRGADLVIIDTIEEQNFARTFDKLTWIGLSNSTKTRQWTWVDGTQLTTSYWGVGEPNNFEGKIEKCVEIRFHEEIHSWNDIPCSEQNFWICEKKLDL